MEAKKYRIGNYVKHPRSGFDVITGIDVNDERGSYARFKHTHNGYYFVDDNDKLLVNPIELEEIYLKDFGFENRGNYWMKPNSNFWFGITLNKNNIHFAHFDTEEGHMNIDLSHLHKLQNFFFAVTGEELTVKHEVSV